MTTDYGVCRTLRLSPTHEQDKDSIIDYEFLWAAQLNGDTISTSTFLFPDGLAEDSSSNTTTAATVFVDATGGYCGFIYRVTNRVTTTGGRTMDKTIRILISEQ